MENRAKFKSYYPPGTGLFARAMIAAFMCSAIFACSSARQVDATPELRLKEARRDMDDRQFETALATLEELREVTAGTRLGGEVMFLMAESKFEMGKYPEADSLYESYLTVYPDGPFARQSLFNRAMSNLRMIEKTHLGFFTLRSFIPHDRDGAPLSRARSLFSSYLERYPDAENTERARQLASELMDKEGLHELGVATFYLRKNRPAAALARAAAIAEGNFSAEVRSEADDIVNRAQERLSSAASGKEAASP